LHGLTKDMPVKKDNNQKIFVLDTSVILYDHNAIRSFEEHDVAIPIHVLEELDNFKKGNDTVNFEAREFIRTFDDISKTDLINDWIPLNGQSLGKIKVVYNSKDTTLNAEQIFGDRKYDHKILNAALSLQTEFKNKKVILVTKDICLRLKAKALNLLSEDYQTGKIKDVQHLYSGKAVIDNVDEKLIEQLFKDDTIPVEALGLENIRDNQFFILRNGKKSVLAYYNPYTHQVEHVHKKVVSGIQSRNAEQAFCIHALNNPNIKLVTLQGIAGTGKTLLALASALEQRRHYRQIFVTRPIVALSNKDIGYLPGDVKSKLDPYMEPLWDNLKFIKGLFSGNEKQYKKFDEMLENEKIAIAPLSFIRGRSLSHVYFIVDEAQNLTPHEVKTIISRAGDETKIVFTGDINQIDTPYLDAQSNGLSYLIDKVKSNPLFAHITLEKGERSELANLASEIL
jgi:PhoH-like ATPase